MNGKESVTIDTAKFKKLMGEFSDASYLKTFTKWLNS